MKTIDKMIWALVVLIIITIMIGLVLAVFYAIKITKENNPQLTSETENTTSTPIVMTKEMEECFAQKLGAERIMQLIVSKSDPSAEDLEKVKECIN